MKPKSFSSFVYFFNYFALLLTILVSQTGCGKLWGQVIKYGSGGGSSGGGSVFCASPASVSVNPVYPVNGANWNDYVSWSSGTGQIYSQPDTACAYTETKPTDIAGGCIHGGELRVAVLPAQYTSCSGITATDALGAFTWACANVSGTIKLFSMGLAPGKGLGNLITSTAFLNNSITVKQNTCTIANSASTAWWTNTITALPDNHAGVSLNLASASTIYVLAANQFTPGYIITANKVAVVTLPGVTLQWNGTATQNCSDPHRCIVGTGSIVGAWIEGTFNGAGAMSAEENIDLVGANYSQVRNSTIYNASESAIYVPTFNSTEISVLDSTVSSNKVGISYVSNPKGVRLYRIKANNNTNQGIYVSAPDWGNYYQLYSANNGGAGITIDGAAVASIQNLFAFNNGGDGIALTAGSQASANVILTNFVSVNNADYAIQLSNSRADLMHGTLINNGSAGLLPKVSTQDFYHNIFMANNSGDNFDLSYGISNDSFSDFVIGGGAAADTLPVLGVNNLSFINSLLINSSETCSITGGSNQGIDNSCNLAVPSTGTKIVVGNPTTSFVGKRTLNDSANGSPGNPLTAVGSISDWFNFTYAFEAWGLDGGAFMSTTNAGNCNAGSCRIWDWSLSSSDVTYLNFHGTPPTSGNCPVSSMSTETFTDSLAVVHTFLINAIELSYDPINNPNGNNNGLCESNETCVYTPNLGAYQGDGSVLTNSPCKNFSSGAVTGVTLYSYPTNGH